MKRFFLPSCYIVAVLIAISSCEKSAILPLPEPEASTAESSDKFYINNDSIRLGANFTGPLSGSLTNLVSENFELNGNNYYCYHLKLEKLYTGNVYNSGMSGATQLSYSINFKFFTSEINGFVDEEFTVEMQGGDIISYYKMMDKNYANDKKAIGYLRGDKTFDTHLNSKDDFKKYWNSENRLKSGKLQIKKSGEIYKVTFEGTAEDGETVSCDFSDKIELITDNSFESREEDFSVSQVTENYIEKGGKYYKLNVGDISFQGDYNHTIHLKSWRDYYRYEYAYWIYVNDNAILQHSKSNALVLQFQFAHLNQIQEKVYKVVPSDGIYSIHPYLSNPNVLFQGFPNDSLCIGYYHIAAEMPGTLTFDEDQEFMSNQIALKSGEVKITKIHSGYEVLGSFTDARGEAVKVKFNVAQNH